MRRSGTFSLRAPHPHKNKGGLFGNPPPTHPPYLYNLQMVLVLDMDPKVPYVAP